MVPDLVAGKGALGGIHSAVHHAATPHCLVVACDMPFLNAGVLRYLAEQRAGYDVVVPSVHGRSQPLHAVYGKACLRPIARRLETARLNVVSFFPDVRVREVTAEDGGFRPRGSIVSQPEHAGGVRRRGAADGGGVRVIPARSDVAGLSYLWWSPRFPFTRSMSRLARIISETTLVSGKTTAASSLESGWLAHGFAWRQLQVYTAKGLE